MLPLTRSSFLIIELNIFGMVKMRNFSYSKILGIRDMCVLILILDIRYIPYLCFNLTSSFALDI